MQTSLKPLAASIAVALAAAAVVAVGSAEEKGLDGIPKKAPATRPTAVLGVHELMELFNEPLYMLAKKEVKKGKPSDDEGWKTLKHRGLQAAEVANLVEIRPMSKERREEWSELTRGVQQAGLDLAHAAEAKDWDKTQHAWETLIDSCNRCHKRLASDHAPQLKP